MVETAVPADEPFTPAEARAKAADLRVVADELERLAGIADAC